MKSSHGIPGGLSDVAVGPLRRLLYFYFWGSRAPIRGIDILLCSLVACIPPFLLSASSLLRPLFLLVVHAEIIPGDLFCREAETPQLWLQVSLAVGGKTATSHFKNDPRADVYIHLHQPVVMVLWAIATNYRGHREHRGRSRQRIGGENNSYYSDRITPPKNLLRRHAAKGRRPKLLSNKTATTKLL